MLYLGTWGKLIHEKNQKSKISWHCPFKSKCFISTGKGGANSYLIAEKCEEKTKMSILPYFDTLNLVVKLRSLRAAV